MHATTFLRRLTATAGSLALVFGLAACADGADPAGGVAFVVGARSNMPTPTLAPSALEALDVAVVAQSYTAVVVADGEPFAMEPAGYLVARDDNAVVQEEDRERNRRSVQNMVASAKAQTPETDLLMALEEGRRAISSAPGNHTLVVIDSGLSTTGSLDFEAQPRLLEMTPEAVVEQLRMSGNLPDLTGVDVVFQGLGDVADPQARLTMAQRNNLVDIWIAIVEAAQAADVVVDETPLRGDAAPGLPFVSPVPLAQGDVCVVEQQSFDEGDIAFLPDSDDFRDPAAASATLAPIAKEIMTEHYSAHLTGTTANVGDMPGQIHLSELRAAAVRAVLVGMGVPAERVTAEGVGSNFDEYVEDRDANGDLVPEAAIANRSVIIKLLGEVDVHCV